MRVHFQPPQSRSEFWERQLGPGGIGAYYGRWREPQRLRQRFEEVVRYCREHNIRVSIVIPPTHVDLQRKIAEYRLDSAYGTFLRSMADAGDVLNLDVPNARNSDPENFGDPFHANGEVMRQVAEEIVSAFRLKRSSVSAATL
jgi:hypothetical protein